MRRRAAVGSAIPCGVLAALAISTVFAPHARAASDPSLAFSSAYSQAPALGSLSAGWSHACAVRSDGAVDCWGDNTYGQSVPPAGTYTQVAAGTQYTCGLKTNGTVSCWGNNFYGQSASPAGTFTQVTAGSQHACGLRTEGTLACWGDDTEGQSTAPAGTFTQVSAGALHTCGLRTDGTATCWGKNDHGQTAAPAGTFSQVAAGGFHACGVRTDGTLACWGWDAAGQSTAPGGAFTQVGAGFYHSCGLKADGTLACWGYNGFGQAAFPPGTFTLVSPGANHSCGLQTDGAAACWGDNSFGESAPPQGAYTRRPIAVGFKHACRIETGGAVACWGDSSKGQSTPPGGTFTQLAAGAVHTCGLRTDGTLTCWGGNDFGQSTAPAGTFTQVIAGSDHTCGLRTDGTSACWGWNAYNQSSPLAGAFTQLAAGIFHTCGLRTDGTVACWGRNDVGQSTPPAGTFTKLTAFWSSTCGLKTDGTAVCWGEDGGVGPPPAGTFIQISRGNYHMCGLRTGGTAECWGYNGSGQAGPPPGTFAQVAAGQIHTCGVKTDGALVCWGDNSVGQVASVGFEGSDSSGAESKTPAAIGVALKAASTQTITVNYATANGTATAGGDYTARAGLLTFLPGQTRKTIGVPTLNNTTPEPAEDFTVTLSNPVNAPLGANAVHTYTILDDDLHGAIRLSSAAYSVGEGGRFVTVTAQRVGGASGPVDITYSLGDGTATAPADYHFPIEGMTSATLSWADGDRASRTFTVPVIDDALDEGIETFRAVLSSPTGGAVLGSPSVATVTIVDNDPLPAVRFTVAALTRSESDSGDIDLVLSAQSAKTVSVRYATVGGSAVAGRDFTATAGTAVFLPGQTVRRISVPIIDDTTQEPQESFTVTLSNPVNATLGTPSRLTYRIYDDDPAPAVQFVPSASSGAESTTPAVIGVALSAASGLPVTVRYATASGTALAGSDFVGRSGTLSFAPGETSKTISVPIVNDAVAEPDEYFAIQLRGAVNAGIGVNDTHIRTILDEDLHGALRLSSATYSVGEAGPAATVTVQRVGGASGAVEVSYATWDGTAIGGGDYSPRAGLLAWADGERASKILTVPVVDDAYDEGNETFRVVLSAPTGGAVLGSPSAGTVTIIDNDPPPAVRFGVGSVLAVESITAVGLDVVLSAVSEKKVTVKYATANGTARAGSDYVAASGTLTFDPGATTRTISLSITNDTTVEPNETFTVNLSGPVNAVLGTPSRLVYTILNDDTAAPLAAASAAAAAAEQAPRKAADDFDGDGRSDYGVFDPASGNLSLRQSAEGDVTVHLGLAGALPVTGDFDGDGRWDYGVYEPATGEWTLRLSAGGDVAEQLGKGGAAPVTGDFDGDGRWDYGVYEPATGEWTLRLSAEGDVTERLGKGGALPVTGDFDGDGRTDIGVYDPARGSWTLLQSTAGEVTVRLGSAGAVPVTGDFDGDGRWDIALYDPATALWHLHESTAGDVTVQLGSAEAIPVTGDFDGDGATDIGCYTPPAADGTESASPGTWQILQTTAGLHAEEFGGPGAAPLP